MKNLRKIIALVCVIVMICAVFNACATDLQESAQEEKTFTFEVVNEAGESETQEITTNAQTVGDALLEEGLIEGDEGDYGLYVTAVHGITLDYAKDGAYWAFYVNGEYAQAGVDQTDIEDGGAYSFKYEKAQ